MHIKAFTMKNILLHLLTLIILVKAQDASEKSVEYYLNLVRDFMQNASQWEEPTDSRRFFQVINEQEEAGKNLCYLLSGIHKYKNITYDFYIHFSSPLWRLRFYNRWCWSSRISSNQQTNRKWKIQSFSTGSWWSRK